MGSRLTLEEFMLLQLDVDQAQIMSIMLYLPQDTDMLMVNLSGTSKIHGDLNGEWVVISKYSEVITLVQFLSVTLILFSVSQLSKLDDTSTNKLNNIIFLKKIYY